MPTLPKSGRPELSGAGVQESRFSLRLRETTMAPHRNAESETFIVDLMAGRLDTAAYVALLEQYSAIYDALESQVHARVSEPVIAAFHDEHLERASAVAQDLDALSGTGRHAPRVLDATRALAERIASGLPAERLLAHHYLRYLGDLSGGLAIARLVARHYDIPPEALNMYSFPGIPKPKLFKDEYRAKLDSATLSDEQQNDFIDEAALGYRLNQAVFHDLGVHRGPTAR